MTDKSFGDHMNRNIVKNPLLSTAVTGLSLEDLTHNAVLLPVSRSQEVITRSDHQPRPQYRTLGNADNANTTYPPGDSYAKQNPTTMPFQTHPTFPAHGTSQNIAIDNQKLLPTPSKALPKSGDDFDVNEYFARLEGTHRYVSAPLNVLKDESNANIRSTEENLEEINLNEPDKAIEQHSITADIAQNFSQLPAVLPQVASAVFSSFSNMLSMKSRENTPEEVKPAYQQRSEGTVELMSVPEVKDVAPPPKEPPIVGTSNYRLPPKKKYAQIPGLSTGDSVQNPLTQPAVPFGQASQPPAYFTQSQQVTQEPYSRVEDPNRSIASRPPTFFMPTEGNLATGVQQELNITADNERHSANATQNPYDFYNPAAFTASSIPGDVPPYQTSSATLNMPVEFAAPKQQSIEACTTPQAPPTTILTSVPPQSGAAIIPPPPMFSNMTRKDSQGGVGRTILPPSVARRISSNHPVIKQQTTQHAVIENIFMPIMSDSAPHDTSNSTTATVTQCDMKPPSAFAPIVSPIVSSPSVFMPSYDTGSTTASVSPAMPPTAPTSVSTGPPISKYGSTSVPSPGVVQPPTLSETAPATLPPTSNLPNVQLPGSTPAMFTPSVPYTQSETSIPPPTFFNPSTATSVGSNLFNPTSIPNVSHSITSFPAMNPPVEPPKPVAEPPKATGAVNYRLAKKRPQYYAGPIEGIGAISNNVKPMLQPPVDTSNFQGGFFLPQPVQDNTDQGENQTAPTLSDDSFTQQQSTINQSMPPTNIVQATVPFDITKPIHQSMPPPNVVQATVPFDITKPIHQSMAPPSIAQATVPFDITKPIETVPNTPFGASQTQQGYGQSEFNTAFDLSRSGEDRYEPPKQESKGFGLIGSLKSKLSSIDINKIQNSVTTFFDPTYNDTKQEAPAPQYNAPYEPQPNAQYGQYSQQETSNFEIFVPSVNSNQYSQAYGQDQSYSNQSQYAQPNYGQTQNQYYQQQDTYFHQNQDPNAYPSSVCNTSQQYFETTMTANVAVSSDVTKSITAQERLLMGLGDTSTSVPGPITTPSEDRFGKYEHKDEIKEINVTGNVFQVDVSAKNYFDISSDVQNLPANVEKISSDRVLSSADSSQIQYDVADNIVKAPTQYNINENSLGTPDSFFTNVTNPTDAKDLDAAFNKFLMEENKIHDVPQSTKDNIQSYATPLHVPSTALLGLSDTSSELSRLEHDSKNVVSNDMITAFNRDNNSSFLNVDNPIKEDDKIDLNICQTCREVARPEERELDNLTDQLIENITAPIQLLNPVEVPLTESNPDDGRDDFNSSQCAEISHITEETIETIQVQSATELLDDPPLSTAAPGYGWATDGVTFPTENPLVEHYLPHQTSNLEHAYSMPNPNSIGFYASGTASPLDNIPNNASDEIKAEFKFSHDDSPILLSRQMSIPSAPPAEDDNKSDETGIDVHSIEQDASKDFPFFEEYVIEPSETDDDKIDFKERNTSEEVQEVDSFTNRVERFKKMEESHVQHFDSQRNVGMNLTNTISPSIPLASYFDTGNYAVETHYRNSISSPTIDLNQIRIPPGFEEEYQRRLSGQAQYSVGDNNEITPGTLFMPDTTTLTGYAVSPNFSIALNDVTKGISSIPNTHTQTRHTFSPTFSMAQNDVTKGTPYIPDTNTQDAPTFSSLFSIALTSASIISTTAVPKTSDYIPEQSLPGSDDVGGTKKDILQEITPSISRMFLAPTPDDILAQIPLPLQIDESEEKADGLEDVFAAIDKKGVEFLPPSVFTNIKDLVEETEKESAAIAEISSAFRVEPPLPSLFSFPSKPSEIVGLPIFAETAAATMTLFPNTEDIAKNMRPTEGFAPDRPKAFAELTISNAPKPQLPNLPDPLNFFATNTGPAQRTDADSGFNRLASYFASPTKTDNTKSFFELSQSQDHYRQEAKPTNIFDAVKASGDSASNAKTNLNLSENKNILKDTVDLSSLPADRYLANMNLMKDLTSPQNMGANEQVVRTINYFTVEYDKDNAELSTEYNIGEPETLKKGCVNMNEYRTEVRGKIDDNSLRDVIEHCKHCSDFNFGHVTKCFALDHEVVFNKDYKVKTCMDNNTGGERERERTDSVQSNDLNKDCVTVEFGNDPMQQESDEGVATTGENRATSEYTPVKHHWFYGVESEGKSIWRGFSVVDSKALEDAYHSPELTEQTLVPTDGGRFDVNVVGRLRVPVYWADKPSNVRRCSWFYKGTTDARYVPYTEAVAEKLEEEYRHGVTTGEWHRRLVLPNNELVVMHGPAVMVHFLHSVTDPYSSTPLFVFGKRVYRNPPKIRVLRDQHEAVDHLILLVHGAGEYRYQKEREQSTCRPRVVRRSCDDTEIEDIEPSNIDHLLLLCHGVGSACDMRFRSVEQVALDPDRIVPLASLRFPIIASHMPHCFIRTMVLDDLLLLCQAACFASGMRFRLVRLEVDDFRTTSLQLLQSHYKTSYEKGKVGRIEVLPISWHATLHSGETGVDRRLARITLDSIPRLRNFTNDTVLDVLFYTSPVFCQTIVDTVCAELNRIYALFSRRNPGFGGGVSVGGHSLGSVILYDLLGHQPQEHSSPTTSKKYVAGASAAGPPLVNYPRLDFKPVALYALGSPIAIFECIRGVESLGEDFALPTCRKFFNIFHPYDPIAYRIEPLINPQLRDVKPFLIPHHKGRKRMHLELKETMARVGADIKARLIESIKTTWSSMWKSHPPTDGQLAKVVEEEIEKEGLTEESSKEDQSSQSELSVTKDMLGKLNSGRRIDYVLQEAPLEMINEYLFAMSSHVCYWESEDTMLLMLREVYDALGVPPDATAPPATMAVPRERIRTEDTTTVVMNVTDHPSTSRGGT